ncbi:A24 family peptidase [Caldalkalibacillus mannanilyticus]|uniref:A24 family peptidase n=1 Tax=Caldalkalibacillus mannanilyticus TaxID=1418 RepID=UPI000468F1C1|nr:prepilin peptidase [Caldalkalibacillus mannanilyticus]
MENSEIVLYVLLGIFLLIAFYTDARTSKIPNWLTVSGAAIGFLYYLIVDGWGGLLFSFVGFLVGFGVMFVLYLIKAISAGDVKLFGAIGALTGLEITLYGMMYSIFYAAFIGIIILLFKKEFWIRIRNIFYRILNLIMFRDYKSIVAIDKKEAMTFPFMYAVLPAMITTIYLYITI